MSQDGLLKVTASGVDVTISARTEPCEDVDSDVGVCSDGQTDLVLGRFGPGETAFIVFDAFSTGAGTLDVTIEEEPIIAAGPVCTGGGTPVEVVRTPGTSIPDSNAAGATDIATVSETGTITNIQVGLDRITHTFDGDLEISLIGPSGADVLLSNRHGSSGDNYVDTVFSDDCVTPIGDGSAPFIGCFAADELLNALVTEQSAGNWTLKVIDRAGGDVGTIDAWTLRLCIE
jgi:subtilisin-like proprotein convertase family protein